MHSASLEPEIGSVVKDGGEVLVAIAALVTEVRIPSGKTKTKKGFYEGPHCPLNKTNHQCDLTDTLCSTFGSVRDQVLNLWKNNIPICLEVLLGCSCHNERISNEIYDDDFLLEKWFFTITYRRNADPLSFNFVQLMHAIRSQLYFSQLTAWLALQPDSQPPITGRNLRYRLSLPGEERACAHAHFAQHAVRHEFPQTDVGPAAAAAVSFLSAPRAALPPLQCRRCRPPCTLTGKHRCEDPEAGGALDGELAAFKRLCGGGRPDQGRLLLEAIERGAERTCDRSERDIISSSIRINKLNCNRFNNSSNNKNLGAGAGVVGGEGGPLGRLQTMRKRIKDATNIGASRVCKKLTFDDEEVRVGHEIPTASDKAKFRKSFDSAASMVFHSGTGLPLTSSPAPVRRGKSCFDFDDSINSVQAIKSALFSTSFSTDDESESDTSIVSPCSPDTEHALLKDAPPPTFPHRKGHAANLLGSFEESVLNGRLEPVSTVHGFTAELGASGAFVPKHLIAPVTVFFYTLGDNDKVSSPYLGHINLGKRGYNVPKSGTIQVTLFNPLGTVVKMFVVMYDLSDMPANSQTFIRQRTFYMPTGLRDANAEWGPKWLRYLIHLRFISSKSGKVYLHSDIRVIIFRKSDMDTAAAHGIEMSYELRSFTHMPINPRFSPRK